MGKSRSAMEQGFLKCVQIQEVVQGEEEERLIRRSEPTKHVPGGQRQQTNTASGDNDSCFSEDDGIFQDSNGDDEVSVGSTETHEEGGSQGPDESIILDFRAHCQANEHARPLSKSLRDCIQLMGLLRKTKASLASYDAVMEWHLKANGDIHPWEKVSGCKDFRSRKSVFDFLRKRYNMENGHNNISRIVLPSSKASVNVVWTDAKKVLQSLLTDPRIRPSDYIFDANDPFAGPQALNYVTDLHTGKGYAATYKKLITHPEKQILLPTPLHIDGAATGQFSDHEITAVKISLGIFNRKARDQPHMWKTLGYIPPISKSKSRGERLFIESQHLDAVRAVHEGQENEGLFTGNDPVKAQDLHTMLDKILESFVEMQDRGFKWDLFYNGTLYEDVEFIPYVPFIKCDTDEADKLCGSYRSRGRNVAQLCRYCQCPTHLSDDPFGIHPPKTKHQIQSLVNQMNVQKLKELSQQMIQNATYKLRFGLHNKMSVHGATPIEMLHALLLGIFKYLRDTFFEQMGHSSKLADEIDALAKLLGKHMSRQSTRNKPKTKFSNGIRKGKLMAKEYTGILLCMLMCLKCGKGQKLLARKKLFKGTYLVDWVMLIETLLQWEEWMKSEKMMKKHVRAARDRHRHIMYLIRKVANRQKGMGLKTTKFHSLVHISEDILNHGVPMEVDTGANESHHKLTIMSAKLTQRVRETFEIQAATRLNEAEMLALAEEEIKGRPLWDYFDGYVHDTPKAPKEPQPYTGGAAFRVHRGEDGEGEIQPVRRSRGKQHRFMMEEALLRFVNGLQDKVIGHYEEVLLHTFHRRNGQIFRANASFKGTVWRDWVHVDWGADGILPCKIWGFVDLQDVPNNFQLHYGGLSRINPGVYAIVESAGALEGENNSELVTRIETECTMSNGKVHDLIFYLADVEAFVEPAMVVPDVGGPENSYLCIENRSEWATLFENWLDEPFNLEDLRIGSDNEEEEDIDEEDSDSDEDEEGGDDEDSAIQVTDDSTSESDCEESANGSSSDGESD